jgi:hypothetical protein
MSRSTLLMSRGTLLMSRRDSANVRRHSANAPGDSANAPGNTTNVPGNGSPAERRRVTPSPFGIWKLLAHRDLSIVHPVSAPAIGAYQQLRNVIGATAEVGGGESRDASRCVCDDELGGCWWSSPPVASHPDHAVREDHDFAPNDSWGTASPCRRTRVSLNRRSTGDSPP